MIARVDTAGITVIDGEGIPLTRPDDFHPVFTTDADGWLADRGYQRVGAWIVRYDGKVALHSEATIERVGASRD